MIFLENKPQKISVSINLISREAKLSGVEKYFLKDHELLFN